MGRISSILQVILPIFVAMGLGVLLRRTQTISKEGMAGIQQLVVRYLLPCVLFNAYLTCELSAEALVCMGLLLPLLFIPCLCAFHARKKSLPYHNLPLIFTDQESGALGIPLFLVLFGQSQVYHMAALDLTQGLLVLPVIALLSAKQGDRPTVGSVLKGLFTSPLLLSGLLGLGLNLSGLMDVLDRAGIGPVITATTQFLAAPISALMLFSAGYHFSLDKDSRPLILQLSLIRFLSFAAIGLVIQAALCLVPNVNPITRWAVLLYSTLPCTYIGPSLGRTQQERMLASSMSSVLTVVSMLTFCVIAAITA